MRNDETKQAQDAQTGYDFAKQVDTFTESIVKDMPPIYACNGLGESWEIPLRPRAAYSYKVICNERQ